MNTDDANEHDGLSNLSRKSEDVAQYYDDWATGYDETLAGWRYDAPARVARSLRAELAPTALVLDAGCGTGLSGSALRAAGFTTIDGIDVSRRSIQIARDRGVYRDLQELDMQKTPFPIPENAYDGLACVGVLTYLTDSDATLREFCRVVKPGGAIVVTQRSDLFAERGFQSVLDGLTKDQTITGATVSEGQPYLPENDEFADRILVHYIAFSVV